MNPKYGRALIAFACLALAAVPVVLSPLASQAQSDPTELPSTTVAHAEPAAITDIYFAPEINVDLEAPESLRAPAEKTLLVGYDAAAAGRIDHFTTSFEPLSESRLGTGQQLALDGRGNLYSGYQDGENLRVITAVCSLENDPALPAAVDYQIVAAAGVVQPRGIAVIDSLAITLVADSNPELPMIALFGKLATGETILGLRLTALDDSHPTDLTYDAANDRLFVATEEGTVLVFNDYSLDYGVEGPDQVIVPYDPSGTVQAVNSIKSLAYDAATDTLVLADSGEAGDAADGQILVLNNVTLRSSAAAVRLQIKGAETQLLDPLDVAFDGSSIYVADASGALLRFDDVLASRGILALAPNAEIPTPDIRSVVLLPVAAAQGACQSLPDVDPTPTIAGGAELLTQVPSLQPPTSVPPTAEPPANEQPPAAAPTSVPPTAVPPTSVPPTMVPPTPVPPTTVPPTSVPPTSVPPTSIPPTATSSLPLPLPTLELPLPLPTVDLPLPLPTVDLPIIGGGGGNGGPSDGHGPGNDGPGGDGDGNGGHGHGNGGHGNGHGNGGRGNNG